MTNVIKKQTQSTDLKRPHGPNKAASIHQEIHPAPFVIKKTAYIGDPKQPFQPGQWTKQQESGINPNTTGYRPFQPALQQGKQNHQSSNYGNNVFSTIRNTADVPLASTPANLYQVSNLAAQPIQIPTTQDQNNFTRNGVDFYQPQQQLYSAPNEQEFNSCSQQYNTLAYTSVSEQPVLEQQAKLTAVIAKPQPGPQIDLLADQQGQLAAVQVGEVIIPVQPEITDVQAPQTILKTPKSQVRDAQTSPTGNLNERNKSPEIQTAIMVGQPVEKTEKTLDTQIEEPKSPEVQTAKSVVTINQAEQKQVENSSPEVQIENVNKPEFESSIIHQKENSEVSISMIKSSDAKPVENAKEAEVMIQTAYKVQVPQIDNKLKDEEEKELARRYSKKGFKGRYQCYYCWYSSNEITDLWTHCEKFPNTHNIHDYVMGDGGKRFEMLNKLIEFKYRCMWCSKPYHCVESCCLHIQRCRHNKLLNNEVPTANPTSQDEQRGVEVNNNQGQPSGPNGGGNNLNQTTSGQNNLDAGGAPNPPPNPSHLFNYPMMNINRELIYATIDLSRQCNRSDKAALKQVLDECLMIISAYHGNNAVGINWMLSRFRRRIRRDSLPRNFDELTEDQILNITQSQVSYNMSLNSASKALRSVQSNMAKIRYEELDVEEKKKQIQKYFVNNESKLNELSQPIVTHYQSQFDKIRIETILSVISQYDDSTSPSVSGMAPRHWKHLATQKGFLEVILKLFNEILENPEWCKKIPNLFRFQEVFIPKEAPKASEGEVQKKEKKYRPICFSEILLNIFEKCILKQVQEALPTIDEQFCNKSNGLLKAKAKLIARQPGQNLIVLDIHNAFNEVPRVIIKNVLKERGIADINRTLIEYLLDLRHSELQDKVHSGTPQGSPLSSVLFTAAINPVLEHIKRHGYDLSAYADDICLIVDNEKSEEALKCATDAFARIGLTLTEEKCQDLRKQGEVEFLGQKFKQEAVCMADDILIKLKQLREAIIWAKLPVHTQFKLFQQCVVPACNYAPLIEASPDKDPYKAIDDELAGFLKEILKSGDTLDIITKFATRTKINGGLSLIFPYNSYDVMREAREIMKQPNGANVFNQLMKNKQKSEVPNPTAPKIGFALNSYRNILDAGVTYLLNLQHFKLYQKEVYTTCPLCGKDVHDVFHEQDCCKHTKQHLQMHNRFVYWLLQHFKSIHRPRIVCADLNNRLENELKPDLILMKDGREKIYIDVSFTIDPKKMYQHKINIYQPFTSDATIVPIIINKDCTIHEKSLEFLKQFPEIKDDELYTEIGVLLANHFGICADIHQSMIMNRIAEPPEDLIEYSEKVAAEQRQKLLLQQTDSGGGPKKSKPPETIPSQAQNVIEEDADGLHLNDDRYASRLIAPKSNPKKSDDERHIVDAQKNNETESTKQITVDKSRPNQEKKKSNNQQKGGKPYQQRQRNANKKPEKPSEMQESQSINIAIERSTSVSGVSHLEGVNHAPDMGHKEIPPGQQQQPANQQQQEPVSIEDIISLSEDKSSQKQCENQAEKSVVQEQIAKPTEQISQNIATLDPKPQKIVGKKSLPQPQGKPTYNNQDGKDDNYDKTSHKGPQVNPDLNSSSHHSNNNNSFKHERGASEQKQSQQKQQQKQDQKQNVPKQPVKAAAPVQIPVQIPIADVAINNAGAGANAGTGEGAAGAAGAGTGTGAVVGEAAPSKG